MSLPLDGERLMPDEQFGTRDWRDHIARYLLACSFAPGRAVLDIACGEGYGSQMLHEAGGRVTGADISPRVVEHARNRYAPPGLRLGGRESEPSAPAFFQADIRDLPWAWNERFEMVVCFETIEHVAEWEPALASLSRVRAPGGFLVISTPNKGVYGAGNPYHRREVTTQQFEAELGEHFDWVKVLRQVEMPSSLLIADREPGRATYEFDGIVNLARPVPEMYAVAVCGDGPIDVPSIALA